MDKSKFGSTLVVIILMAVLVFGGVYWLQATYGDGKQGAELVGGNPAPQAFSSSDFEHSVMGKSKSDVIALLGQPIAVNSGIDPGTQTYDYSPAEPYLGYVGFRVIDDMTGSEHRNVTISFDASGLADRVLY